MQAFDRAEFDELLREVVQEEAYLVEKARALRANGSRFETTNHGLLVAYPRPPYETCLICGGSGSTRPVTPEDGMVDV